MTTLLTMRAQYEIELPFPLSTNRLWRASGRTPTSHGGQPYFRAIRVHLSPEYTRWKREADALYMTQKQALRLQTLGVYGIHCVFSADHRRKNQDGDNLTKCVNDWLQRVEIIKDDCLCERGSWEWGAAPTGCIVRLDGELLAAATAAA
jgi:Holliday junction resolvase RusA-like endonuclease